MNAENPSSSIRFESKFGAEKQITPNQYIAEILVEREAAKSNIKLPNVFWKNLSYKAWTQKFLKHKRKVDGLIRAGYSYQAILNILRDKKYNWCYSLYNKQVEMAIHEESRRLETLQKVKPEPNQIQDIPLSITKITKTPSTNTKKNKISKLRD